MHSDFGQLILDQVNERQRLLANENNMLERAHHQNKSEADRLKSETELLRGKLDESKTKLR